MKAQKAETALGEAFQKAGFNAAEYSLASAVQAYKKSGGERGRAVAIVASVFEMQSEGQSSRGLVSHSTIADAQHGTETTLRVTPNGHGTGVVSERAGLRQNGKSPQVTSAQPVREPTTRQRAIAAEVRTLSVLDTFRIRDGRPIGKVRIGEIERLRASNAMEASIFRQIQRHAPTAGHDMTVEDVIKPEEFQRMQQRAAEIADVA